MVHAYWSQWSRGVLCESMLKKVSRIIDGNLSIEEMDCNLRESIENCPLDEFISMRSFWKICFSGRNVIAH